ncbi:hypothetical protein C8Q80DRAFT_532662 [Daedaleopsis nitida]|nr:hypothetical protein C8Q80DRAFT_532662 [Daedaleopsis nitida]
MEQVDRTALASAAARRVAAIRQTTPSRTLYMPFDEEHDNRQKFRRRIDREILASNTPAVAIKSLKTVLTLARNILAKPDDPQYRRFKISNKRIQETVMVPKGVLQLVMDLGFRIKAEHHDSYCVYTAKTHNDLRVGSSVIEETLEREVRKAEEEERRREREEEERKAVEEKEHMRFLDDRKSVDARVARERRLPPEKGIPARRKGGPVKPGNIVTLHG